MLQPEEEIQRFMIEEDLSECERIKLLLNKRDPNQYGYVFLNAVSIFRNDIEMQREILPLLVVKIRSYSEDQQIIAGDAFSELIEQQVSPQLMFANALIVLFPKILDDQFAEPVFTLAEEMLNQWSR